MQAVQFIKISVNGKRLPADAKEWEAVLDTETNLMWSKECFPVKNGKEATVRKAVKGCSAGGFSDWGAPTRKQQVSLVDDTRQSPAINTDYFPDTPCDWFWTITPYAGSPSDLAWFVHFAGGYSRWYYHRGSGFVRAVRPSQ